MKPDDIPGWFRASEADAIAAGCRTVGGTGALVEIGTWCGKSTALLAERLPDWTIWTVDAYKRDAVEFWGDKLLTHPQALAATYLAGVPNVRRLVVDSLDALALLPCVPNVLFIDGDHTRERVSLELRLYLPYLPANGLVWLHDCDWPGVLDALESDMPSEWCREPAFECLEHYLWCYRRTTA